LLLKGEVLIRLKVCGTTNIFDARKTAKFGVDYLGIVVDVPFSERSVSVSKAREIAESVNSSIDVVVLFFNQTTDWIKEAVAIIKPFAVQLLGNEPASVVRELKNSISCQVWKSVFLPPKDQTTSLSQIKAEIESYIDAGVDAILLDTADISEGRFGGTGKISNWSIARDIVDAYDIPIFLAGGINPQNVTEAIKAVNPYGIDLCSGVEKYKGKRDFRKLKQLMNSLG